MVKADNEAWRIFDRKDWLVFMGDQYKVKTPPDGSLRGADRERAPSSVLSGRSLAAQTAIITAIIVIIAGCVSKSESGHDSLSLWLISRL